MINFKGVIAVLGFALLSFSAVADPAEGEELFKVNCKACHHLQMRLVGPALKDVDQRHSEEWLLKFIKSSQSMIQSGDSAAVSLFKTYNEVPMPDHDFTDEQVRSILEYIKVAGAPQPAEEGDIRRPEIQVTSDLRPMKFTDYRFWILYTITVILVIVSVYYKAEMVALSKRIEQ